MPKNVTAVQNVPYSLTLERITGVDPQIDFLDFECRDIICHIRYRVELKSIVCNSRLNGKWLKEQSIEIDGDIGVNIEVRFGAFRVWISCSGKTVELELPFRSVAERIGLVRGNGFTEAANLLLCDFMQYPILKSMMSSLEYTVMDARVSALEEIVRLLLDKKTEPFDSNTEMKKKLPRAQMKSKPDQIIHAAIEENIGSKTVMSTSKNTTEEFYVTSNNI